MGACSCPVTPCEQFNHPSIVQGQILQSPGVPFPPIPDWDTTNSSVNDCSGNNNRYLYPTNSGTPAVFPTSSTSAHYHTCNPGGNATVNLCVGGASDPTANYFFNSLTISGTQQLELAHCTTEPTTGIMIATPCSASAPCAAIRLYANVGLNLGGNGVVGMVPGDPTKFSMIYSGTADTSYTGTSDYYGTIYAPNATLNLKGGAIIYGAVSAKNVLDTGSVTVHYDLSLQDKSGYATSFRLVNQTRRVF